MYVEQETQLMRNKDQFFEGLFFGIMLGATAGVILAFIIVIFLNWI
jgi:hypothetical protein